MSRTAITVAKLLPFAFIDPLRVGAQNAGHALAFIANRIGLQAEPNAQDDGLNHDTEVALKRLVQSCVETGKTALRKS